VAAPIEAVHQKYHDVVPYETRLKFWSYRERMLVILRERTELLERRLIRRYRIELKEILARHPEAKGIIIVPPCVEWDTPLFQRPHQMAIAFASLGYLVLYWVRKPIPPGEPRIRNVRERLYVCNVPAPVFGVVGQPIVISYTYNYNWVTYLKYAPTVVYELIDHLDIFSNFSARTLRSNHQKLLRRAKVVVGTADDLVRELKVDRGDAILCPNGVDMEHFAPPESPSVPPDIQAIVSQGRPIIGYYGALAEWFDFELLRYAASALTDYNFVLLGPDYDGLTIQKSGIDQVPNIFWLGQKRYSELPAYLAAFSVATIPFRVTEALQAVSPIKLFEYMAGGRPIVTTDLVECRKYPVVLIARNQAEWVARLKEAVDLSKDPSYLTSVRQTAEQNTWTARATTVIDALGAVGSERGVGNLSQTAALPGSLSEPTGSVARRA
jgi:glycosyltransferase involved in cell wall biosynthesis